MTDRLQTSEQMSPETLEALKGSIVKWEAIVAGTGLDEGVENCPLCKRFWRNRCDGCPVNAVTGSGCGGSPYDKWSERDIAKVTNSDDRQLAQAELDFLKSLLPRGTP